MSRAPRAAKSLDGDRVIVYRDPAALVDFDRNTRTHTAEQIRSIRASIDRFGFNNPILLKDDDKTVGAGHARRAAALLEPALARAPTITLHGLTDEEWRAYVIADNRLAEAGSGWNDDLLRAELGDLKSLGFDLSLTGFNTADLTSIFGQGPGGSRDPDAAPPLPADPVARLGDVFILGGHRIMCGDSLDRAQVDHLLGGVVPDFANCDPPYGVKIVKGKGTIGGHQHSPKNDLSRRGSVDGPSKNAILKPGVYAPIIGDETVETAVGAHDLIADLSVPVIVLWGGNYFAHRIPPSAGWLVWDKENTGSFADVEMAWTNRDKAARLFRHQWSGLIKASERGQKRVHPTQKPVALADWVHQTAAPGAKTVLDLFLGSGAVLISAERAGIACFGMELAPAYIDCAVERWRTYTGKEAYLEDGTPWPALKAMRVAEPEAV